MSDIWSSLISLLLFTIIITDYNKIKELTFLYNMYRDEIVNDENYYINLSSAISFKMVFAFQLNTLLCFNKLFVYVNAMFIGVYGYYNLGHIHIHLFSQVLSATIYLYIDAMLEKFEKESKAKDLKVMKVIHDLKNPILSIKQIINNLDLPNIAVRRGSELESIFQPVSVTDVNNSNYLKNPIYNSAMSKASNEFINYGSITSETRKNNSDQNQSTSMEMFIKDLQKQINSEVEDVEEMIENLKTEFKSKNHMQFKEEIREVESIDFLESFKNTHAKLAESGKNRLNLQICHGFPRRVELPKSLAKRIMNNFVSNSLKHTTNGSVTIIFTELNLMDLEKWAHWRQLGSHLSPSEAYIVLRVQDNGKGIPKDKLGKVFEEKVSDQSGENWDGCGLGLPICEKLAIAIGARIFYNSVEGSWTSFALVMMKHQPIYLDDRNSDSKVNDRTNSNNRNLDLNDILNKQVFDQDVNIELDFRQNNNIFTHNHVCNSILIAEDNANIAKRYSKYLDRKQLPYFTFMNGSDCLSYVLDELKFNCKKCVKMLILTDLYMPFMDGQELASEVRKIDTEKRCRLVLLSADEPSQQFKSMGLFDEILLKPLQMAKLSDFHNWLLSSNSKNPKHLTNKNIKSKKNNENEKNKNDEFFNKETNLNRYIDCEIKVANMESEQDSSNIANENNDIITNIYSNNEKDIIEDTKDNEDNSKDKIHNISFNKYENNSFNEIPTSSEEINDVILNDSEIVVKDITNDNKICKRKLQTRSQYIKNTPRLNLKKIDETNEDKSVEEFN